MKFKITPENALFSVKLWLNSILCWPLPQNASRKRVIFHNIAWCIAVFIPVHLLPTSYMHYAAGPPDPVRLTKNIPEFLGMIVTVVKIIICKAQNTRLRTAIVDLEEFIKTAGPHEREVMDRYISRCGKFYLSIQVLCFLSGIAFACGPVFLPQPLPGHSEYPFEWKDSPKLKAFLYFTHVLGAWEVCASPAIDIEIALLLWVSGVRFELLAECFENARSPKEFHECVEKHQQLLASVNEITIVVQYFILDVMVNTGITNICIGYQFVSHQPIGGMIPFAGMFLITSLQVAMYSWPADNLLSVSENIAQAVYSSPWFDESRECASDGHIVMIRSQKPLVIGINGIIPAMNLEFYAAFLSTSYSYFTTLRALVE